MSIRPTPFLVGEYYHLYNRGVDKRDIFLDERDYKRFQALLYLCNSTTPLDMREVLINNEGKAFGEVFSIKRSDTLVDIGAYCPMPNHFHILVHEKIEGGISVFMQKLATAYSMYFNRRYERRGALFESKFKTKHIDSEAYFNWVFSYIHLNPVKLIDSSWKENGISDPGKAKKFMNDYKYSSYYDYFVGNRPDGAVLNKEAFPEYFGMENDFEHILKEFSISPKQH